MDITSIGSLAQGLSQGVQTGVNLATSISALAAEREKLRRAEEEWSLKKPVLELVAREAKARQEMHERLSKTDVPLDVFKNVFPDQSIQLVTSMYPYIVKDIGGVPHINLKDLLDLTETIKQNQELHKTLLNQQLAHWTQQKVQAYNEIAELGQKLNEASETERPKIEKRLQALYGKIQQLDEVTRSVTETLGAMTAPHDVYKTQTGYMGKELAVEAQRQKLEQQAEMWKDRLAHMKEVIDLKTQGLLLQQQLMALKQQTSTTSQRQELLKMVLDYLNKSSNLDSLTMTHRKVAMEAIGDKKKTEQFVKIYGTTPEEYLQQHKDMEVLRQGIMQLLYQHMGDVFGVQGQPSPPPPSTQPQPQQPQPRDKWKDYRVP